MKKIALFLLALTLCLAAASCSAGGAKVLNGDLAPDRLNANAVDKHRSYDIEGCIITPKPFSVIINTEEEFNGIFTDAPEEISVDFSKETLIIYVFKTEYHRDILLKNVSEENGILTVEYKMESPSGFFGVGDAATPFERFVALKIDSKNIDSAVFVEVE